MNTQLILADPLAGDTQSFWHTSIGDFAGLVLASIGIIIVIVAALKAGGKFFNGKTGDGVKILLLSLVVAAFCIYPAQLIGALVGTTGSIIQKVSGSVDTLDKQSNGTGGGDTTPTGGTGTAGQ